METIGEDKKELPIQLEKAKCIHIKKRTVLLFFFLCLRYVGSIKNA